MNINILPQRFTADIFASENSDQIEEMRREIDASSERLRIGQDTRPERTARRVQHMAGRLVLSHAAPLEKAMTLAAAAGNLKTGHFDREAAAVRDLAVIAIELANPHYPEHPALDEINEEMRAVQLAAIGLVDDEHAYPAALVAAQLAADELQDRDYEHDVLEHTEEIAKEARAHAELMKEKAQQNEERQQRLRQVDEVKRTHLDQDDAVPASAADLFDDDDDEPVNKPKQKVA